jgi:hypothetical protein
MAWPEAMVLSPDGERVALVERGDGLRMRIVRAASEGAGDDDVGSVTELDRAVDALPELAFADAQTLAVRGETLRVFRR